MNVEMEKEERKEKKEAYQSQDGFIWVPLYRGFTEIQAIYELAKKEGASICGGYARYCASPRMDVEPAADVDVFSPNDEVFNNLEKILKKELAVRHTNDMAITFSRTSEGRFAYTPAIQLIKPVKEGKIVAVGSQEDILDNFDFTIIRACIVGPEAVLVDADFLHDEAAKILRLKNIHCPISSTLRCMKYARKGYWLPPMQSLKLFLDWDSRDQAYRNKLVDFLQKANEGEGLSQKEVDELEALMRID